MNRPRRDCVTSDKSKAFADLLYFIVVKLDTGTPHFMLADEVKALGRAMEGYRPGADQVGARG